MNHSEMEYYLGSMFIAKPWGNTYKINVITF